MIQLERIWKRLDKPLVRRIGIVTAVFLPTLVLYGQVPGPQPTGGGSGLNTRIPGPMVAQQTDLNTILTLLGSESKLPFSMDQGINPKVTFNLESPTVKEVLDTVLPGQGLDYFVNENGTIRIGKAEVIGVLKQGPEQLISQSFVPLFVPIEVLKEPLTSVKTDAGQLIFEPDSNRIFAMDTPDAIAEMEKILAELDIETETRVFEIEHADITAIVDQLEGVINTQEGELVVDERNSLLIITDTIDRLDFGQIARINKATLATLVEPALRS